MRKKNRRRFLHRKYYLKRARSDFDKIREKIEANELSILQNRLYGKLFVEELKLLIKDCEHAGIPTEVLMSSSFITDAFRFSKRKSRSIAKTIKFNKPEETGLLEQSSAELRDFLNVGSKKNERTGFVLKFFENSLFNDGGKFVYVPQEERFEALERRSNEKWQFSRSDSGYKSALDGVSSALGINLEDSSDDLSYKIIRNAKRVKDELARDAEENNYLVGLLEDDNAAEALSARAHKLYGRTDNKVSEQHVFNNIDAANIKNFGKYEHSPLADDTKSCLQKKENEDGAVKIVGIGGGNLSKNASAKLLEQVGTPLYEFAGTIDENNKFKKAKDNMTVLFIDERTKKGISFSEILKNPELLENSPNISSEPILREIFKERLAEESIKLSKTKRLTARL